MSAVYLIAGGGTGGHIFPAIAIGQALQRARPDARIYFVGTRYGMEKELLPRLGLPLLTMPMRGLLGKSPLQKLELLWRIPVCLVISLIWLLRFRPKVVIGVGGYASAPLLFMAGLLRFPTLIQEQNAIPGATNRVVARFARLACLGFAAAAKHFRCPTLVSGNPVRQGFRDLPEWNERRDSLLVLGGSQGAKPLNEELPALLQSANARAKLRVLHQCGRGHLEAVRARYRDADFSVEVVEFIQDVPAAMARARLILARSGASTVSEIQLARVPVVFVPFARATHDHQTWNARVLADRGAALLLPESELASSGSRLSQLLDEPQRLAAMAHSFPKPGADAAETCAQLVFALEKRQSAHAIIEEFQRHVS